MQDHQIYARKRDSLGGCKNQSNYSGPRFPRDRERRAFKDRSQSSEHGTTLLTHAGQIAANHAKGRCSLFAAEGARNLLLNFDHAQIALSLIVGEWDREIIQEGQDVFRSAQ